MELPGGPAGIAEQGTGRASVTLTTYGAVGQATRRRHVRRRAPSLEWRRRDGTRAGPGDNNLWFVETVNGRVGRTDTGAGAITPH